MDMIKYIIVSICNIAGVLIIGIFGKALCDAYIQTFPLNFIFLSLFILFFGWLWMLVVFLAEKMYEEYEDKKWCQLLLYYCCLSSICFVQCWYARKGMNLTKNCLKVEILGGPMSKLPACKDCKFFRQSTFKVMDHICTRPRESTHFNPLDGEFFTEPNLDIYTERAGHNPKLCGIPGQFYEEKTWDAPRESMRIRKKL